jgi:hypothetical protein
MRESIRSRRLRESAEVSARVNGFENNMMRRRDTPESRQLEIGTPRILLRYDPYTVGIHSFILTVG